MTALSVVIPTFNTAAMTQRCVRAVLASMPEATEVIVVDDGSTDNTAELLAADVKVIRLETNSGFSKAANRGVSEAKGNVILLLNSDAFVEVGALRALLAAFDDPAVGIAGAQLLNEDGTLQWSAGRTPTLAWIFAAVTGLGRFARFFRRARKDESRDVDWVSGAAMAVRREAWTPLNERYRFYCQDLELCVRARAAGWRIRLVAEARVLHGLGKTRPKDRACMRDDLLTWGTAHYGRAWGRFARVALAFALRAVVGSR